MSAQQKQQPNGAAANCSSLLSMFKKEGAGATPQKQSQAGGCSQRSNLSAAKCNSAQKQVNLMNFFNKKDNQ